MPSATVNRLAGDKVTWFVDKTAVLWGGETLLAEDGMRKQYFHVHTFINLYLSDFLSFFLFFQVLRIISCTGMITP